MGANNNRDTMVIKDKEIIHINRVAISNNKIHINSHTGNNNINNLMDSSSLRHINNRPIRTDRWDTSNSSNQEDMVVSSSSSMDNNLLVIGLTIQLERKTWQMM